MERLKNLRALIVATLVLSLWGSAAICQDALSGQVLERHDRDLRAGDIEGVMADYADDAVAFIGGKVYAGKPEIREMFRGFMHGDPAAFATLEGSLEPLAHDITLQHFVVNRGRPNALSGTDVFMIRNGKIVFQSLIPPQR